jgi:hypothetical protein
MRRRVSLVVLAAALGSPVAGSAASTADGYVFDGGTAAQRGQVQAALEASSFDWSQLREGVTVHIRRIGVSHATRGHVWLDADLLASGKFAWATVLDEFAHQVDFQLLDDDRRSILARELGASVWCYETPGLSHSSYGCERFASTFAWAYWPSIDNAYRPRSRSEESAAMPAPAFRRLLAELLSGM